VLNRFLSSKTGTPGEEGEDIQINLTVSAQPPTSSPTMADFTAPATHGNPKNLLSADVEIKGSIKFQNDLTIDGKVEGEIASPGNLTVGENAEIRGEIKTKSVTVHGKVHGNITVEERCELKARAVLHGDLKASRLVIEDGATFVGKSEVTPNRIAMKQPEIVRNPNEQKAVNR
jgi:cytoskeletal protein CcmA (bactofilin family)